MLPKILLQSQLCYLQGLASFPAMVLTYFAKGVDKVIKYYWYPVVTLLCCLCISDFQDFHSGYPGRVPPNQPEQRLQPAGVTGTELTPEPLYFEVREGFL